MSQRTERLSSLVREAVQNVIARGLQDPRVRGLITVTRVTTAEDLSQSTVYISVLPAERAELTMHGLKAAAKHIRHEISGDLAIRRTPKLIFKLDSQSSRQAGVLDAIAKARSEFQEEPGENEANNDTSSAADADADPSADTPERSDAR